MTYKQRESEKEIQWACDRKQELSNKYAIPASSIVWIGGNKFVVCFGGGKELLV